MRDHGNWSLSLGRWGGLGVRLHMFFLLFAAFTLYLGWMAEKQLGAGNQVWLATGCIGILFFSVLLHELGHCQAARRLGGGADQIVLGPLGGMVPVRAPRDPRSELLVHLAGPGVNLIVCLACVPLLLSWESDAQLLLLLHPLLPHEVVEGGVWNATLKLTFWINYMLLLANLLPAYPFDGGRALRAALSMVWTDLGRRRAAGIVTRLARVVAVGLLVVAWVFRDGGQPNGTQHVFPTWFALVLLAIFLYFSAKQEEGRQGEQDEDDELFGYDFSQGYTSLERSGEMVRTAPGPIARWLERRRQTKMRRQSELEADEERRVDEILVLLHEQGMESLSEQDRLLLERVSARYRNRLGDRT